MHGMRHLLLYVPVALAAFAGDSGSQEDAARVKPDGATETEGSGWIIECVTTKQILRSPPGSLRMTALAPLNADDVALETGYPLRRNMNLAIPVYIEEHKVVQDSAPEGLQDLRSKRENRSECHRSRCLRRTRRLGD